MCFNFQVAVPIYYCAFCGEEYDNKVNLLVSIQLFIFIIANTRKS